MHFDFSTFLTNFSVCSILLIVFSFVCLKSTRIGKISIYSLLVSCIIIAVRLLMPFEWGFTYTVKIYTPYAVIGAFLGTALFEVDGRPFMLWYGFVSLSVFVSCVKLVAMLWTNKKYKQYIETLPTKAFLSYETKSGVVRNIRCVVDIFSSKGTPHVVGFKKPTIVLTKNGLSPEEIDLVIRHELTHIRKHDLWLTSMAEFICVVYWWNPLAYAFKKIMIGMLEIRVDHDIVGNLGYEAKKSYMRCLLKVAKLNLRHRKGVVSGFSLFNYSILKHRFDVMFSEKKNNRLLSGVLVSVILVVALSINFVGFTFVKTGPQANMEEGTLTAEDFIGCAYLVLNSEGRYDVYMNDEFWSSISDPNFIEGLPVYNSLEEVNR